MKKFAYLVLAFSFCCLFLFGGCSDSFFAECKKHVSDERQNYFWGETDTYNVSFSSGMRESPYVLDGKPNKMVEFGIITISPKKRQQTQNLVYEISIDNQNFSGEFEQSPFDDTYAGDIGKVVKDEAVLSVNIKDGGKTESATLECLSKGFNIKSEEALEIATNQISENIQDFSKKQNFEVHIKIVADINQKIADKFWLVMFLGEDGNSLSVLINPTTGKCETKKV